MMNLFIKFLFINKCALQQKIESLDVIFICNTLLFTNFI
ncbi:hypothetical protein VCRA2123O443_320030 [Vibrio crassostreae]|nr:hypothetical protein VCRA2110O182_300004 [Vibrio crassostreae]CAK2330562.1 hypothetical protein VCRA2111O408_310029 [Vibrio crassostreae]CAK2346866.1 hypothetical protein VCRA211O406_310004 [Vibrio crassostreae]CAK3331728.1 hypothetical protein VCRA2123O443_320030 [Vibrio crassostreae]